MIYNNAEDLRVYSDFMSGQLIYGLFLHYVNYMNTNEIINENMILK